MIISWLTSTKNTNQMIIASTFQRDDTDS
uniref:Uncharacterized protein n=1 Tax=Arundo donax TaxID=35708 RepID=A0A0A9HYP6_ARUDO